MRLIDADALKKALKSNCDLCHDKNTNWCENCCPHNDFEDFIDNAPTVPQDCSDCKRYDFPYVVVNFDKEQMQEIVDKAKAGVLVSAERPQGEWLFLKANEEQTDGYECSVCKRTYHTRVPYFSEFNFCPNCGADMRKGGAE